MPKNGILDTAQYLFCIVGSKEGLFNTGLIIASFKQGGILPCRKEAALTPPTQLASPFLTAVTSQEGQRSGRHVVAFPPQGPAHILRMQKLKLMPLQVFHAEVPSSLPDTTSYQWPENTSCPRTLGSCCQSGPESYLLLHAGINPRE